MMNKRWIKSHDPSSFCRFSYANNGVVPEAGFSGDRWAASTASTESSSGKSLTFDSLVHFCNDTKKTTEVGLHTSDGTSVRLVSFPPNDKSPGVTEDYSKSSPDDRGEMKVRGVRWCLEVLTRECFFLEDRSSVVSYKLSTKFLRHGTFTSFFTVWRGKTSRVFKHLQTERTLTKGWQFCFIFRN